MQTVNIKQVCQRMNPAAVQITTAESNIHPSQAFVIARHLRTKREHRDAMKDFARSGVGCLQGDASPGAGRGMYRTEASLWGRKESDRRLSHASNARS